MKKIFLSLAAVLCMASAASAQTLIVVEEKPVLTNKRGVRILPQAGDVSIGISATPFLAYFGNMFTSNGMNPAPVFMSNGTGINFKLFTTDNQAIRAGINVNFGKNYFYGYPTSDMTAGTTVTDRMKTTDEDFALNIGYEWRRGMGRLQGFMGVQMVLGYSRNTSDYTYGNEMNATHTNPWSWNFNNNTQSQVTERIMSSKSAANCSIGLGGFVGVEYFFAPKMSVGGELGLGLYYVTNGETEYKSQAWDAVNSKVVENTTKRHDPSVATDGFGVRTGAQGNLFLSFYF